LNSYFLQKILILFSFFSLFITIITFKETYGKYVTNVDESANIKIARWRILINGEDVKNNATASTTIVPVFTGNDNIQDNVIAPHAEGYFDLIIDGKDADVSFNYDVNVTVSDESSVKDLIVTGYSINDEEKVEGSNGHISNTVLLTDETKLIKIRVYIKWNDDETTSMTNEDDTYATMTNVDAKMNVSMKFTQMAQ